MQDTITQFEAALKMCRDLFVNKLKDYGAAWRIMRSNGIDEKWIENEIELLKTTTDIYENPHVERACKLADNSNISCIEKLLQQSTNTGSHQHHHTEKEQRRDYTGGLTQPSCTLPRDQQAIQFCITGHLRQAHQHHAKENKQCCCQSKA